MKKILSIAVTALLSLSMLADAGSSFSSGSRSSSSSSSGSRSGGSSYSSGKSSFSSGSSKSTGSGWGSSNSRPTKPTTSNTTKPSGSTFSSGSSKSSAPVVKPSTNYTNSSDSALTSKAAIAPKVSREQSIAKFKQDNADKFPTKFSNEPTQRPAYIPQAQTDSYGTQRPVYYDRNQGGYGYWDALGTFIIFDALTDRANHSVPATTVYPSGSNNTVTYHQTKSSNVGWTVFWIIIVVGLGATAVIIYIKRNERY